MANDNSSMTDLVRESGLLDSLSMIKIKLDEAIARFPQYSAQYQRINTVLSELDFRIKKSNAELTSKGIFKEINESLSRVTGQLSEVVNHNGNIKPDVVDESLSAILERIPLIHQQNDIEFSECTDRLLNSANEKAEVLSKSLNDIFEAAEAKLKAIGNLEIDGKKLVHLAAGKIKANDYLDRADAEKKIADSWTNVTWGFAGATILVLLASVVVQVLVIPRYADSFAQTSLISLIVSKLVLTIALGVIAKWASKRASRHLMDEARYRRLGINTATLDSFISELDPAAKNEVTKAVAIHIFTEDGRNDSETGFDGGPIALNEILSTISRVNK